MSDVVVPVLSSEGWITDIRKKADQVMAYFFASDYSQSNLFYTNIASLAWLVQQYGNDTTALQSAVESTLQQYLERYFTGVRLTVTIEDTTETGGGRYNIILDATVVEGEYRYSLGKLIETQNNKVVKIIDYFNKGTST